MEAIAPPVFLYDGDCAFCSTCARALERWVPTAATSVPWQWTDLDELGVTSAQADASVIWVIDPLRHTSGPEAFADLLRSSPRRGWRAAGWLLDRRPVLLAAWPIYRWIARNRHRMPGGTAQCALPHAERTGTPPSDG